MQRERSFPNIIWKWLAKKKEILAYLMAWPTLEEGESFKQGQKHQQLEIKQHSKTRTGILLKTSSKAKATLQWIEAG